MKKTMVWPLVLASVLVMARAPVAFGAGAFGGEISFLAPTKFRVERFGGGDATFEDIVAGDVDGDGDQDLILIKGIYACHPMVCSGQAENEVRLYLNQFAELGSPDPPPTAELFRDSTRSDAFGNVFAAETDGLGNMHVIYADGRSNNGTGTKFNRPTDMRARLVRLAVAYKIVDGKKVVDYILVSREYQGGKITSSYYNGGGWLDPRHYAGRIIHLKNPYDGTNPDAVKGPWPKRDGAPRWDGNLWHPGHLVHFDVTTPPDDGAAPRWYNDDYTWKTAFGDVDYGSTFNTMDLADLDGDGDYDLYAAPAGYSSVALGGNHIQFWRAAIYRYTNHGTNDFNAAYNDSHPGANHLWGDASALSDQFYDMQMKDVNGDGTPDLLGAMGGSAWNRLSWIRGMNDGTLRAEATEDKELREPGSVKDVWAGNLRGMSTDTAPPDLLAIPLEAIKRDQLKASYYNGPDAPPYNPFMGTYTDWTTIYGGVDSSQPDYDPNWDLGVRFRRVITADLDNDGVNEIVTVTDGGGAQFWVFKKNDIRRKYLSWLR